MSHPNLSDEINANLEQSEKDGGVWLKDLAAGDSLFVVTENHTYRIKKGVLGRHTIEGHPTYCPQSTKCTVRGSTWGGSMLKIGFIGKNMHMEFWTKEHGTVTTSLIRVVSLYGDGHD